MLCSATHLPTSLTDSRLELQDVVLVRKTYADKERRGKSPRRRERGRWVPVEKGAEEVDAAFER